MNTNLEGKGGGGGGGSGEKCEMSVLNIRTIYQILKYNYIRGAEGRQRLFSLFVYAIKLYVLCLN